MIRGVDAGRLHHVAIAVPSLHEASAFYRDMLGYTLGPEHLMAEQRIKAVFATREDSRIELIEPTDTESGVARFVAERGRQTMHHLCFEVRDLGRTLDRLAAEGVDLIDHAPRKGIDGLVAFIHPRATGGVLIELIELAR